MLFGSWYGLAGGSDHQFRKYSEHLFTQTFLWDPWPLSFLKLPPWKLESCPLFPLIFLLTCVLSPLLSLDAWKLDSRVPFPFHSTDYVFCSWPQLLFAGATWHFLVSSILVKNVIIHAQRKDTLPLTSPIHVLSYRRVSNHHHPPGAPQVHL